jgi:pimeloyl-ACP methyl ester carboxylesterase
MVEPPARSRLLAAVSVAQLATGVAGMVVALRRRHPYDVFWMHGRPDAIARDTIVKGTALSAPVSNLLVQAALTAVVARRPSRGAARALGGLGALQVAGYLGERLVRRRLRPSGWDAVESPLVVAGIGLAGAMAALGRQVERRDGPAGSPSLARARGGGGRGRSVRDGSLHGGLPYLAVGAGPPLVVFSGLSAEHANPTGLARWLELQTLKPMARHFTVYAVNRKPGLPAGSTIGDLAGHYAEAIAREFPGPVCVQGISTGGSIAQQFAIDHPQLVRRLVLAATACRLSPYGQQVQRRFAALTMDGRARRAYAALGPALAATAAGGRCFASLMWLFGASQRADDPSDMLVTVAAEDVFDASPELHRITAPTLLVAGGRDRFYSPELFRETADRIPDARLSLYQDKGHAGVMTHKPAIARSSPSCTPTTGREPDGGCRSAQGGLRTRLGAGINLDPVRVSGSGTGIGGRRRPTGVQILRRVYRMAPPVPRHTS